MATIHDLVLSPHCDLHLVLTGGHQLVLRVALRESDDANPPPIMTLTPVLPVPPTGPVFGTVCDIQFFEPHAAVGSRFGAGATGLPFADPITGLVTATRPGVFLFQAVFSGHAIVGRLQVHNSLLEWRFGNRSATTAMHPTIAHTQPTIYARFSDDGSGADLVGDITGHGYVQLTTSNQAIVSVDAEGRLHGRAEGSAQLTGSLAGGPPVSIPVSSVRYDKIRHTLEAVRTGNAAEPVKAHNMIFLAEGFPAAKKDLFDEIVTTVVDRLFDESRHEPYGLLGDGFNAWKAFEPSQETGLTCGFTVNPKDIALAGGRKIVAGHPIPYQYQPDPTKKTLYTVSDLVQVVGLPKHGETRGRADLISAWQQQSLTDAGSATGLLDPARIDDDLIVAWKAQSTEVLLEARDTYYGLVVGKRLADRESTAQVPRPAADAPQASPADPALTAYVNQLYEFYRQPVTRTMLPDARRHPPAVNSWETENLGYPIMRYLDGQEWSRLPGTPIGSEVVPSFTAFKRSRGLVAIIAYDDLVGGTNFGNLTITGQTVNSTTNLIATPPPGGPAWLLRREEAPFDVDVDDVTSTVAHEFGHSFNLDDEYEESANARPTAAPPADNTSDNVTTLGAIFKNGTPSPTGGDVTGLDGTVSPTKIKWANLPRMALSTMLIQDSEPAGGNVLKVTVDRRFVGAWVAIRDNTNLKPSLRNVGVTTTGQQLPLQTGAAHLLENLVIGGIQEAAGTILLTSPVPPGGFFHRGSVLYLPKLDGATPLVLLKEKVRTHLAANSLPLNRETDIQTVNLEPDEPVDITGFNAPCRPYRLIGVFEGADGHTAGHYRPTGMCKMRTGGETPERHVDGVFCHVCKWLIVNRINPGLHATLDKDYPEAKKNG